jgi:hypothetical protein
MSFFSSIRIIRIVLAIAVALWMAGAGCLLGCENTVNAAANNSLSSEPLTGIVVAGDVCASAHSHDCCAKHDIRRFAKRDAKSTSNNSQTNNALALAPGANPSQMMDGCPLAVNATAALSKGRYDQSSVHFASTAQGYLVSNTPLEQTIVLSPPLRLANRGHTYLRCCVFRI